MSKRKANNKKCSYPRVTSTTHEKIPVVNGDIKVVIKDGMVTLLNEDGTALDFGDHTITKSYRGKNKQVKLSKLSGVDTDFIDISDIPQYFDYLFAIDTNKTPTKNYDFYNAAGCAVYCEINQTAGEMTCRPYFGVDWYCSFEDNLEPHTWKTVIKHLQEVIPSEKKVGIVVDSEYDKLDAFNKRAEPVVYDWYLPDNYTFIFATADKTDDWCNKAIRHCDKLASQRLTQIMNDPKDKIDPDNGFRLNGYICFLDEIIVNNTD